MRNLIDLSGIAKGLSPADIERLRKIGIGYFPEKRRLVGTPDTDKLAQEVVWRKCAADPEFFLIDSKLVTTLDNQIKWDCPDCGRIVSAHGKPIRCPNCTADAFEKRDPIQAFPARNDLRDVLRVLQAEPLVAIAKSRRMMATEIVCGYALWRLMFRRGTLCVFQSDKEDKANDNVRRVHGMWSRLPEWMRGRRPANPIVNGAFVRLYFELPSNHSKLKGIPSGPEQIREMGPSLYFCDEAAFHADALATYSAVRQAIEAGCQAVYVSTAAAGFFGGLCYDQLEAVGK